MPSPPRIAFFSPLPPTRSGIADYSAELLPPLAARAAVTLFVDDPSVAGELGLPVEAVANYPRRRWEYDLALYHMGNSSHHESIYRTLTHYPGVVVLHDLFIHHFIAHTTAGQGDTIAYAREMSYELGPTGRHILAEIQRGARPTPLAEVPLTTRLLDTSLATIVHSESARRTIAELRPTARTAVIPQLMVHRDGRSRRAELGLRDDTIIFGSLGQVTAARQLPLVLRALRDLRAHGVDGHLLIVGEILPEADLTGHIAALDLEDHVTQIGYVASLPEFVDWTATADVIVNLRNPTLGETSASVLRGMDTARPTIVTDHGWYSELPDAAVVKLPADLTEDGLREAMLALATDPERRVMMGQAAAAYVTAHCRPDEVARQYVAFLDSLREEWRRG